VKKLIGLATATLVLSALSFEGLARPVGSPSKGSPAFNTPGNPAGSTVGPQTLAGGGSYTNNGTINGGSSTAVTATGPGSVIITNNGTITSSTRGILTSDSSSSMIINNGTISVENNVFSSSGSANAQLGTGIGQTTGP
jgi:hypothetical protein